MSNAGEGGRLESWRRAIAEQRHAVGDEALEVSSLLDELGRTALEPGNRRRQQAERTAFTEHLRWLDLERDRLDLELGEVERGGRFSEGAIADRRASLATHAEGLQRCIADWAWGESKQLRRRDRDRRWLAILNAASARIGEESHRLSEQARRSRARRVSP